jgi:hypothetical protein
MRDDPVARLRAICMALPEAVEKISHGEPTWFAGKGKVFAMLDNHHHGAAHVSVWLPAPLGAQEAMVWRDPKRYFPDANQAKKSVTAKLTSGNESGETLSPGPCNVMSA